MDSQHRTQSSQGSLVPSSQPSQPTTPTPASATLPAKISTTKTSGAQSSLTPPPSSQANQSSRVKTSTPAPSASHLASPLTTVRRSNGMDIKVDQDRIQTASPEELRDMLANALSAVQDAKTTAAHYKLQHQMAQMESGEAVERMAVEMDMAKRELEVLQRTEARIQNAQKPAISIQPESDPHFRLVHVEVYSTMVQEIQEIKLQKANLERENAHQKKVILQQENDIASLNDRCVLMRDRIRESREHLIKSRRTGGEVSPGTDRSTPYLTTPSRNRQILHSSQQQQQQQQQPGFAALLQATDIVSQTNSPATYRRHSRGSQSLSSMPATPQRGQAMPALSAYYTPQANRHVPMQAPHTAPIPRKRNYDSAIAPRTRGEPDSDGTVSANDDSEAETEVPDREDNIRPSSASYLASDMLRSPTAGRGRGMTQTKLFGQIRKPGVHRENDERNVKRNKVEGAVAGPTAAPVHH